MKITRKEIVSWLGLFCGCTILAAGFVFFINPYSIVPGGVYGASIVLHSLFPSIQVGTFGYMFDIPLLALSVLLLGARVGAKTIVAAMTTPLIMNVMSMLAYPSKAALEALDPALMLGGMLDMSDQLILPVIIGSVLIGVGCGVVLLSGGTSGGTDIVAMIVQKYLHIPFRIGIMLADGVVVLFGLVVIGFGIGGNSEGGRSDIFLSFYSLISIYIGARVIAATLNGGTNDKILFIISDQNLAALYEYIIRDLERSATLLKGNGLYTGKGKEIVFLVISYKEVQKVKSQEKHGDPRAFVVVTDAYDAYGEGWKTLPNIGEVCPE